jgi:hypothetical protein
MVNVNTGEIRDFTKLSEEEKATGDWMKIPAAYMEKVPKTEDDFERLNTAEAKRERKRRLRRVFLGIET